MFRECIDYWLMVLSNEHTKKCFCWVNTRNFWMGQVSGTEFAP